jgi:FlaA1/EpsC-like NDP-sugar epimerase
VFSLSPQQFFVLDIVAVLAAVILAFDLRFETLDGVRHALEFAPIVALILFVRPVVHYQLGLYHRVWRYASVSDFLRVSFAVAVGSLVAIAVSHWVMAPLGLVALEAFPLSFWPLEAMVSLGLVAAPRLALRALQEYRVGRSSKRPADHSLATLLFGAGEAGALLARSAIRDGSAGVRPVGFLDDHPSRRGQRVAGLPVFGTLDDLEPAIAQTGARQLLITMPNAAGSAVKRVTSAALSAGLQVRTVPPLHELLDGTLSAHRVRRVQVEDLLRRPLVTERLTGVGELIAGRTIMITGGGGSIGAELARQTWSLGPAHLILVDRAESALYTIERELEVGEYRAAHASVLSVHLANVASRLVMDRLIGQMKPDVILHAAAYKHVPLMETHPSDAVHVNIGGTLAVLEAAVSAGVEHFVLVSTDKAVEPTSVMGATKRVAEWLVADVGAQYGWPYVSVRFGNVLGSNGSVVQIFQSQLERGQPLTITHPDMTRYFMTIPEAAWLILDAAALGEAGDLFVLDMGEPINILDLAKDLARLAGRDPESVPIQITGLRAGEKLTEELFYKTEHVQPTASPKVMRALSERPPPGIRKSARSLLILASGDREETVRRELFRLVNNEGLAPRRAAGAPELVPVFTDVIAGRASTARPDARDEDSVVPMTTGHAEVPAS